MTSTKLIGRDAMISRLIFFHTSRIDKSSVNHSAEFIAEKKQMYSIKAYKEMSTRSICKEYNSTFGPDESRCNPADFD